MVKKEKQKPKQEEVLKAGLEAKEDVKKIIKSEKIKKTVEEKKEDGMELARNMGIHRFDLDTIMRKADFKKGFKITQKELRELYTKYIGRR